MATPTTLHEYEIDTHDGKTHSLKTDKSHNHSDFQGSVVKWFNEHGVGLLKTAANVIAIRYGNRTIWKKS